MRLILCVILSAFAFCGAGNAEDEKPSPLVISSNANVEVKLSGRVHRMVVLSDDGKSSDIYHTDSDQGPSIMRIDATGKHDEDLSLGATLEIGLQQNRPLLVNQDERDVGMTVSGRLAEFYLDSKKAGKFSVGRGFAAAWVTAETDLSMTQNASMLSSGMLFGGMKFVDKEADSLTNYRVRDYFFDLERLLLVDRLRYDSPVYKGFKISGSVAADKRRDAALRMNQKTEDFQVVGALTYHRKPFLDINERWDAIISARHTATGLNLTVGGLSERLENGFRTKSFAIKGGWLTNLISQGQTAFSADFSTGKDIRIGDDEAKSFGLFAMQYWDKFGIRYYGGYRRYEIERPDIYLKPIQMFVFGALMQF